MTPEPESTKTEDNRITLRALVLGFVFAGIFAVVSVKGERTWNIYTITQVPVLPYMLLLGSVLLLNPLIKLIRLCRPLSVVEVLIIFIMGMVSSGVPSFGMASQLVPRLSGLFYENWNNDQTRWDLYVEPYVNEDFFIAEPGTREAALRLREVDNDWRETDRVLRAARGLRSAEDDLAVTGRELAEAGKIVDKDERLLKERAARHRNALAARTLKNARKWWAKYSGEYDPAKVLDEFPPKVERLKEETELRKNELNTIETPAFEKVKEFRKGLPKDMRAVPGLVYVEGEGLDSYLARMRRLTKGMDAFKELRLAHEKLVAVIESGRVIDAEVTDRLQGAIDKLEPIADTEELVRTSEELKKQIEDNKNLRLQEEADVKTLHTRRRYAHADQFDILDNYIKAVQQTINEITQTVGRLQAEFDEKAKPQLEITQRVAETRDNLVGMLTAVDCLTPYQYPQFRDQLSDEMAKFTKFDASFRRLVLGDVKWKIWLKPLMNWAALILLTYLVLMTFNVLIFRQWAHNEKIVYPLAELPTILAGTDEGGRGSVPAVFRSGLFWAGVSIPVFIHSWNHVIQQHIPGIGGIPLTWFWAPFVQGSIFDALRPDPQLHIFFILIGLTFLIPSRISYSLWSFHLLYIVQLLVICWLGYGVSEQSFPNDRHMVLNFRTAEGGGALIIFAAVIMWKCRKYLFCCVAPGVLADLESSEQKELKVSSWLFLFGSAAFIAMLHVTVGASLAYSIFYYLMIMVIIIGLMRAVAEGGLLTYKCYFGPFHFIRSVFGMNHTWSAPALMAPLFVFHSVLFMQYKTIIAPAMANALKIRDNLGMKRLRFHVAVAAGILCAFVVGLATHIILGYLHGGDNMGGWSYHAVPWNVFSTIKNMAMTSPIDSGGGKWWLLTGAVMMVALLYFRRRVFWLPHPIGLIMFVNPVMHAFWFSIFIGWVFKVLVSKYGNKDTYSRIRCFFIGLMVADLIMCLLLAGPEGVDFNRN